MTPALPRKGGGFLHLLDTNLDITGSIVLLEYKLKHACTRSGRAAVNNGFYKRLHKITSCSSVAYVDFIYLLIRNLTNNLNVNL